MRKPRDFDAELKALGDRARDLKGRKVQQLGELVIATGADTLSADELAGALIVFAETKETAKREAWARRGAAFFQGRSRRNAPATVRDTDSAPAQPSGAQPASGRKSATRHAHMAGRAPQAHVRAENALAECRSSRLTGPIIDGRGLGRLLKSWRRRRGWGVRCPRGRTAV